MAHGLTPLSGLLRVSPNPTQRWRPLKQPLSTHAEQAGIQAESLHRHLRAPNVPGKVLQGKDAAKPQTLEMESCRKPRCICSPLVLCMREDRRAWQSPSKAARAPKGNSPACCWVGHYVTLAPQNLQEFISAGLAQARLCEEDVKSTFSERLQRTHTAPLRRGQLHTGCSCQISFSPKAETSMRRKSKLNPTAQET